MSKRRALLILLVALGIVAFSRLGLLWQNDGVEEANLDLASLDSALPPSIATADEAIEFFQDRVINNPHDAVSYSILGQMHVRKARETGDVASYQRAEAALEKSLDLLPEYPPTEVVLASVYYARHDFSEALELAQNVYRRDSRVGQALSVMGDAYLELGSYQEAEDAYLELLSKNNDSAVLARLAHLNDLKGNTVEALRLLEQGAKKAVDTGRLREDVAWYLSRLGGMYFNTGHIDQAAEHYEASLKLYQDYYIALAGLGKARAAQGRYDDAIDLYEQSIAVNPQPATLARLGDLYAKVGDLSRARLQYDTVEFIAKLATINKVVYNRELALFYANHDIKLDEALELAKKELSVRKDIYGYDALAWALYKNGQLDEAADAIATAMKLGTRDAKLYYHAGMISYRRGEEERARQYLQEALSLNPHFSILGADETVRTLKEIGGAELASTSLGVSGR
ncbi:MAG: tetratricopeptide repeat protein [Chloroflexi bacterium]|nr:tetratricopeptide repeat protein [Chloroflexota bacterium]